MESGRFERFLARAVQREFAGATMFRARGVWKRTWEDSLVVEVFDDPDRTGSCASLLKRASGLAALLARTLGQESVMMIANGPRGETRKAFVKAA